MAQNAVDKNEAERMSTNDTIRDVRHVKAGRELLRWDQERLATEAGLSLVSVRRYEAARGSIAESIENDILAALERAGIVFVPATEINNIDVSGGVLLKNSAKPEAPAAKRIYVYGGATPGRPPGRKDTSARKSRIT